jgi:hypothetical protein
MKMPERVNTSAAVPFVMYTGVSVVIYLLMGPPILILIVPFAIAYALWFIGFRHRPVVATTDFLRLYVLMYVIQIAHLLEEWNTGFYRTFPALWGSLWFDDPGRYDAWGPILFINGNLAMDAFWEIAILLFGLRNAWANYTLWLFLSGMVVNAIGHPLYCVYLSLDNGLQEFLTATYGYHYSWYFPGLFTAFLHSVIVVALVRHLRDNYTARQRENPSLGEALGAAG